MGKLQKFLGVDPGLTGAFATWDGSDLQTYAIPIRKIKIGREVIWEDLVEDLRPALIGCTSAYIEKVNTRPGEGRSSAFKFGYVAGGFRGIVDQAGIPVRMVTPQKWKKYFDLPADKAEAVRLAASHFPGSTKQFYGPRGGLRDGIAEAALIALYGYNTESANED